MTENAPSKTLKLLMLFVLFVAAALLVAGLFVVKDKVGWIVGVFLGTALSEVKVIWLEKALTKSAAHSTI